MEDERIKLTGENTHPLVGSEGFRPLEHEGTLTLSVSYGGVHLGWRNKMKCERLVSIDEEAPFIDGGTGRGIKHEEKSG